MSLEAGNEPDDSFPHIITIHDRRTPSNVVVGQWQDSLLVRLPIEQNRNLFRESGIPGLRKGEPHVVVISSDGAGTSFYMDGQLARRVPGFVLSPDSLRGQLILGNAATGKRSWRGTLFGLAIFSRPLAPQEVIAHHALWARDAPLELAREAGLVALYDFAAGKGSHVTDHSPSQHHLTIPDRYVVLDKTVLGHPDVLPRSASATVDMVLNVLGFVPFGFLAFLSFRSSPRWLLAATLATLAGAFVSLVIEIGQVWLPTRDSSVLDLAYNTAGTGIGVIVALWRRFS
jgi:VanZ family protein